MDSVVEHLSRDLTKIKIELATTNESPVVKRTAERWIADGERMVRDWRGGNHA
jgi:hypothetical protein